jgi:hypothetical protein
MNFVVFVMSALVGHAFGWWLQELAGGAALALDVFVKTDSVFVAAIAVAAIRAFLPQGNRLSGAQSALTDARPRRQRDT